MALLLNEDQRMLADTAGGFMADHAGVSHLRALRDAKDPTGFSQDLWARFAEMGFTGILAPEDAGGMGLGHVEAGVVLEEIGRNLTPSPFLSSAIGGVTAMRDAGGAVRERWLPALASGAAVAALAFDEGPRHRPAHVALKAERSGNGFRLTGHKRLVAHGHVADLLIVSARTSGPDGAPEGVSLFAVPRETAGVRAEPHRLADASLASRIDFDGVQVEADAVIGEVDQGWPALSRVLGAVRAGAAAELVGVGAGAAALTLDYLKSRRQFDRPIGSFQALQHRAAHLYAELEVARAAVLMAQQSLDRGDGPETDRAVHVAKAMSGLATTLAVQEGVQMHGGVGMTDAYDIGLYMKRAGVLAVMFGDADDHADQLARLDGY